MSHDNDFARLMERVRGGCPDAIDEFLRRYGGHIREVVRQHLNQKLRTQFDSLDFQQDVWKSFFTGPARHHTFRSPQALARYLAEMACHKVIDVHRRRLESAAHGTSREQTFGDIPFSQVAPEVAARNPTPSQFAIANEEWQRLLAEQPKHHRRILELRREGHTRAEIARALRVDERMVSRVLEALRKRGASDAG
jgi:RNA polymerase sigma-70 factor (ECF subfamily)